MRRDQHGIFCVVSRDSVDIVRLRERAVAFETLHRVVQ
jgi:hypothetical protein